MCGWVLWANATESGKAKKVLGFLLASLLTLRVGSSQGMSEITITLRGHNRELGTDHLDCFHLILETLQQLEL